MNSEACCAPPSVWLLRVWRAPGLLPGLEVGIQDPLLRLARKTGLLASLECRLARAGVLDGLSGRIREILTGARVVAEDRERFVRWEVDRIRRAFHGTGLPVILLKGAAYHLRDFPLAGGRLTGDVDLLLPEAELSLAEGCLREHGWLSATPDAYDQHYYREWMHELPPMRHRWRMSEVDLHHAILPRTARLSPDSALLLQAVEPVEGHAGLWTLGREDLLLHAVVHLFHDGDFQRLGLRDLLDLDGLFRQWAGQSGFWSALLERARVLQLSVPLAHALRNAARLCGTPVPEEILDRVHRDARLTGPAGWMLDRLVERVVLPGHPDGRGPDPLTSAARWLLYVRSHWLRMPPHLLLPHLARKWVRRWRFDVRPRRTV